MTETIQIKHRTYDLAEAKQILTAYRTLFPAEEITPALRTYWGWDRQRAWSHLTTDFHAATPEKLLALHEESVKIEQRSRNGELTAIEKGDQLVAAAVGEGVGFSMGVNPWTDNLLWRTFNPASEATRRRLVVLVGHDWYPNDLEAGLYSTSEVSSGRCDSCTTRSSKRRRRGGYSTRLHRDA